MTTPDSITQFCGTQVSPNTAEAYGFQSQETTAKKSMLQIFFSR